MGDECSKQGLLISHIESVTLMYTGEGSLCAGLWIMISLAVQLGEPKANISMS